MARRPCPASSRPTRAQDYQRATSDPRASVPACQYLATQGKTSDVEKVRAKAPSTFQDPYREHCSDPREHKERGVGRYSPISWRLTDTPSQRRVNPSLTTRARGLSKVARSRFLQPVRWPAANTKFTCATPSAKLKLFNARKARKAGTLLRRGRKDA